MDIPDYESLMLPFLRAIEDGGEHRIRDVRDSLADSLGISEKARAQMLPSGRTPVFSSRVHWAKTYLEKAGVVESPSRGVVRIAARGRGLLRESPVKLDNRRLSEFPEFVEWKQRSQQRTQPANGRPTDVTSGVQSPEELLEDSYRALREATEDDLLAKVRNSTPYFFEQIVIDLLRALGYGGASGFGERLGRSGDGGVDGVIWEDKLGLDYIYVQAKRWQASVGRPEVQAFAGSLEGFRARKGVMITTSTFTSDATSYVERIEKRIVLIDGKQLVRLMFEVGIGVSTERSYDVKAIDTDYFDEDT